MEKIEQILLRHLPSAFLRAKRIEKHAYLT